MNVLSVDVERESLKTIVADFSSTGKLKRKAHTQLILGHYCHKDTDNRRKKSQQILVGESDKIYYVGKNFDESANVLQKQCKYFVGIVNESTGKMTVCDVDLFKMEPVLKDKPPELVFDEDQNNLSFRQKADELTKAFGSAKQKKAVHTRLQTQVKGQSFERSLSEAANLALEAGGSTLLDEPDKNVNENITMPPCNRKATVPEDVYSLDNIISPTEMEALTDPAKEFYNCTREDIEKWEEAKSYPQFILRRLSILPLNEDSRWRQTKCLVFMKYLCRLYLCNAKQLMKINEQFPNDCPDIVKRSLINKFTLQVDEANKRIPPRCMPPWMKDKLAYHILVLGLIIDDFSTELHYFQKDLKIGHKKLMMLYRMLGCKINKDKDPDGVKVNEVYTAKLSIPLKPELKYKVKPLKSKRMR